MSRLMKCNSTSLAVLAVLLLATFDRPACGQVDTPAAREARAALRQVQQTHRSQPNWAMLSADLALADVEHELRLGDRAEAEVLTAAAAAIRAGTAAQLKEKPFDRLAEALQKRADELEPVPADQWPAVCRQQSQSIHPPMAEEIEAARKHLTISLDALEKRSSLKNPADPWRKFLFWTETRALATGEPPDTPLLERLETRWQNAPDVWDSFELVEASFAVRSLIHLLRAQQADETSQQRAAAWNRLAELLEARLSADAELPALAQAVRERESLGQGSALTASIRRELSRPNLIVRVQPKFIQSQLSPEISEPVRINGVYAGANTTGRGKMTGRARIEVLPSTAVGRFRMHLDATSNTTSTAYNQGATVGSRANTRIAGVKSFTLDERGLSTQPARANANTRITYTYIDGGGGRIRQNAAQSRTYGMRAQAQRDSSADAQRSAASRMDVEGRKLADDFNRWYLPRFREGITFADQPCPDMRVRSSGENLSWELCLEQTDSFAAAAPTPQFELDADMTISCGASAIDAMIRAAFGGRNMTREQFMKRLGDILGEPPEAPAGQNFRVAFAPRASDSRLADGRLHTTFHVTSFEAGDVTYPALTIEAQYQVQPRDGDLVLVRDGPLRVRPVSDGPAMSGRQQTLRTVVQRTLGKVLAEELRWSGLSAPAERTAVPSKNAAAAKNSTPAKSEPTSARRQTDNTESRLRVDRAQADNGWLQISLTQ